MLYQKHTIVQSILKRNFTGFGAVAASPTEAAGRVGPRLLKVVEPVEEPFGLLVEQQDLSQKAQRLGYGSEYP